MKTKLFVTLLFLAVLAGTTATHAGGPPAQPPISGQWLVTIDMFGDKIYRRIELQQSDARISGTSGSLKLEGTFDGGAIKLNGRFPKDDEDWMQLTGKLAGDQLTGEGRVGKRPVTFSAYRPPARPPAAVRHEFVPKQFTRYFSSQTAPVLHIHPGDSVHTTTVDAGGMDAGNQPRSMGGNPLTGPFYIDGAFPGDTLVVKLNRVRLNRDSAESGDRIVSSAISPWSLSDFKPVDKFDSTWKLDRERGVAMLAKPTEALKDFVIPVRPMLGCVGVAPWSRESLQSGNLGPWGGNMDYSGVREGVTLYFPVFQPGALLYVGDGHALEGDGELTGDALETSMDVEFTVDVIQAKSGDTPRAEDAEYRMALGVGNSLEDALRTATTELIHWLQDDYKLNTAEVSVVLGTTMRYDIAEVVDPQVHIVAKVPKSALAKIHAVEHPAKDAEKK